MGRRLLTLLCLLLAALAAPATVTAPAWAKGATSVTVSGPGIDERTLGFTRRPHDADVGSLAEAAGLYGIFGDGMFVARPDLTAAELGPRYTLTWYEGNVLMVESHVYPFAEDGAWGEVPGDQRLWGEPVETGWWHGGGELQRLMVDLGARAPAGAVDDTEGADATATVDASTPAPPTSSSGFPVVATGSAVLAGLALVAGSVWWLRRRRTPHPA